MSPTPVLAPVPGRAVRMEDVPDPIFAQSMVGPGAAIDPPRGVVEAVAPISGTVLKVLPHAYVIVTAGQLMVTYDVPAVETLGRNPVVPVVALEKDADSISLADAIASGTELSAQDTIFTVDG